jgi:hypothetical protein
MPIYAGYFSGYACLMAGNLKENLLDIRGIIANRIG